MTENVITTRVNMENYAMLSSVNDGKILFLATVERSNIDCLIEQLKSVKELP